MRFGRDGGKAPAGGKAGTAAIEQYDARAVMARELNPGETLIWADQPRNRKAHGRQYIVQAIFGIPFLAFALFWTAAASGLLLGSGPPGIIGFIFPLFGLPFIAVGLGLVTSPLWGRWKAGKTWYALTDRRVIVAEGMRGWKAMSWDLEDLDNIERSERGDGTGDIIFASTWKRRAKGGSYEVKHGFIGVAEPARLERAIRDARRALVKGGEVAAEG